MRISHIVALSFVGAVVLTVFQVNEWLMWGPYYSVFLFGLLVPFLADVWRGHVRRKAKRQREARAQALIEQLRLRQVPLHNRAPVVQPYTGETTKLEEPDWIGEPVRWETLGERKRRIEAERRFSEEDHAL